MNFENFANRIVSSNRIENLNTPENEYRKQQHFSVIGGEMQKTSVMKTNFLKITTNDFII